MNVMKKAHELTKARITEGSIYSYSELMKRHLVQAHKEYKAMIIEQQPQIDWKEAGIARAQRRIAELEAIDTTDGYIVVIGDNVRLPLNEVSGKWCLVENASIFWYREDAQRLAGRCVNGNGEVGVVVLKAEQIKWEIEEQHKLIENLKTGF